jgi:hypothetical protein
MTEQPETLEGAIARRADGLAELLATIASKAQQAGGLASKARLLVGLDEAASMLSRLADALPANE